LQDALEIVLSGQGQTRGQGGLDERGPVGRLGLG
jgi:hypothetical protein